MPLESELEAKIAELETRLLHADAKVAALSNQLEESRELLRAIEVIVRTVEAGVLDKMGRYPEDAEDEEGI